VTIKTSKEARQLARSDAVESARSYLEREAPNTVKAIEYWVLSGLSFEDVLSEFEEIYGPSEEKKQHKIKLIIQSLIDERDE
jgi:hypothetical protein